MNVVKEMVLNITSTCVSGIGDKQGKQEGPDPSFSHLGLERWRAVTH